MNNSTNTIRIRSFAATIKKTQANIKLSPVARLLFFVLTDMADAEGTPNITSSHSELRKLIGITDKSISRARDELVEKGLISYKIDYRKGTTYTLKLLQGQH